MKKLYILTIASLLMAACAEDVEMNNRNAQYITFNVTDQNYLPDPVEDTRSAQASPFEGEAQEFTPQNSLFTYNTATKTPTIDQTPVETDLDEDLCLITTVEDGIHLDNAAATTRGGQVSSGTFSFGVTEYKNGGSVVSSFNNVQFSGVTVSTSSQKVNTGKTWESDAGSSNYDFYACYPYLTAGAAASNGLSLAPDCKTITYNCSSVTVANQQDLMTAYASSAYNKDGISLAFGHRLCAVKIVLSSSWNTSYTIKSINFSSIKKSGTYNITNDTWGSLGTAGSYDVSGITEANTVDGEVAVYLMMIPQTLNSCDMTITLQKSGESTTSTLKTTLANKTWTAGKTVTLTIGPSVISSVTVTYPTGWTKTTANDTPGPVTTYTTGDRFGLFAVDKNNKIVISNVPLTAPTTNSATQTITLPSGYLYSSQYTYYLMYPYSTSATGISALAVGATATYDASADTFFGDVADNWTVSADQSSAANYKSSDLQIAKATTTSATLPINMAHKMGLAWFSLQDKNIVTRKKYLDKSGSTYTYVWTDDGTTLQAHSSRTFNSASGYSKPYTGTSNNYYCIVKKSTNTSFQGTNENTYPSADVPDNSWSQTANIASGRCTKYDKTPDITCSVLAKHTLAIGDILYSSGGISATNTSAVEAQLGTPVGLIFYLGTTANDKSIDSDLTHGYAMALQWAGGTFENFEQWCTGEYQNKVATDGLLTPRYSDGMGDINTTGLLGAGEDEKAYRRRVITTDLEGLKHCKTALSKDPSNMLAINKAMTHDSYTGVPKSSTTTTAGGVTLKTAKTSGWYLPSIGQCYQWLKLVSTTITGSEDLTYRNTGSYAFTKDFYIGNAATITNEINTYISGRGLSSYFSTIPITCENGNRGWWWWTSTENFKTCMFIINNDNSNLYIGDGRIGYGEKSEGGNTAHVTGVRPVIAF